MAGERSAHRTLAPRARNSAASRPVPHGASRTVAGNGRPASARSTRRHSSAWRFVDPILCPSRELKVYPYAKGSNGPEAAHKLLGADGREWFPL